MENSYTVRDAKPTEFEQIGELMVKVYSQLDGFPTAEEQPDYYKMLAEIGELTKNEGIRLFTAVNEKDEIVGAVVYIKDMKDYGSGGIATMEQNAAGFRLLAVDPEARGKGIGKLLTNACIDQAKEDGRGQVIIHSTEAMDIAWGMYEKIGFKRSIDLDFQQGRLPVFGFRLLV
ncbi:GNAT family N-acetyltransferase [Fulvivirga sp. RKSG066]|uniref:GNAT family N-acetyltransferase n=1 Tax=Fulvivirga aurantia TaxID=2529383 RepID=UPI0012BC60A1|nr:GNAT family N-acetyltransferase [Fulvivirga aurantia]MTI22057.1 GNAT family N-acetyltransferase [Fulvivirga aurantia]